MTKTVTEFSAAAAQLSPLERAELIDCILSALDVTDVAIDVAWSTQAADRIEAYRAGEIGTHDFDEVLAERRRRTS